MGITVIALMSGSALVGPAGPALAASKSAPVMTVLTPSSVTAGSTNNLLAFKVQAKQSFSNGSITLTVPAGGWTVPNSAAGVVSTQKGTCANAPAVIATATTFGGSGVSCGSNKYFVVVFKTKAPNVAGAYNFAYSFTSSAGSQAGALTETVGAAAANHLALVSAAVDNAVAGASLTTGGGANPLKVRIEDAYNNLVNSTASVAVAPNKNTGGFGGTTPKNAVAGIATFSNLSETVAATGYTLTASSAGLTSATSNTFDVTHAALTMSFGTQPSDVAVGDTMSNVVVHVADTYGNPGSGSLGLAMANNPRGAALGGTTSQALDSSGDATFNDLTLDAAEVGATLKASFTGLTDVTSDPFDVTLVIVRPSTDAGSYWQGRYGSSDLNWPQYSYFWDTSGNPYGGSWICPSPGAGLGQLFLNNCFASPDVATTSGWVWDTPDPTSDPRGLEYPSFARGIGTWYGSDFDVTVSTGASDTMLTLYVVDWDSTSRAESITVDDGTGPQPVHVTAFNGGAYISAPVASSASVTVHFHVDAGANAVISGFFLD